MRHGGDVGNRAGRATATEADGPRAPGRLRARSALRTPLLLVAAACLLGAAAHPAAAEDPRWVGVPEAREPSAHDRERMARHSLETTRALLEEGSAELAEAAARRGLAVRPEDAALQRELARALAAQGREEEAARARARADTLDPPPPPPPDDPLDVPSRGVLVVLVPPAPDATPDRRPRGWPDGAVAAALEERLQVRLPEATVLHAVFESVAAARAWLPQHRPRVVLSLRVDRIYCGESLKDGRFGMAWLRAATGRPGGDGGAPAWSRVIVSDPRLAGGCEHEVVARALERVLALPAVREALAAPRSEGPWSRLALRALFPGLGQRIDEQLAEGQTLLSRGRIEDARRAFQAALAVDPDDAVVRTYLREAEATLAMSRELSRRRGEDDAGVLEPRLTAAQLAALETSLEEERRRREELLATLAVLGDDVRLPSQRSLAALRPVKIRDPEAFGPALARRRAGGAIVARAAFAPEGTEIARYYFPDGDDLPLLREEDANRDGRPDRWIAYGGDARTEIWEDGRDAGRPDVRLVFTVGGQRLLRVEVDRDRNGSPERVFHYDGGALSAEARDTNGDGRLDTFDRFDAEGHLAIREEDVDGDGEIDVRSHYRDGKLTRREL